MSLKYLLDTCVLSDPLRPTPDQGIQSNLRRHQQFIATASVVWHELFYGAARLQRSRKRTALEAYLRDVIYLTVPILPYDERAAQLHAQERARLESRGHMPAFADGQIAAIAMANDLTLVSCNIKDFKRFRGLQVVDWRYRKC